VVFFAMGTKPKSIVGNKTCKVGEPRPFLDAIIGGGGGGCIFIYSCSAQRISFESDCFHGM
jgi:hypothetical protein